VTEALTAAVIVTGIGICVLEELENTPESGGVPAKMRTCLLVPGNIAWDACDCGQFAQTIQRDYPTVTFPADASDAITNGCMARARVVQVLASIIRCVPGMTGGVTPQPPTCAALQAAALVMQGDAYALLRGVECCLAELKKTYAITAYTVSGVNYVGPDGNCAGVELTYRFSLH
jgi:hypothetical protein